ncbi:hypothetical protein LO763_10205 [Glycomyces sp. A-F 0318]|uniref:hypothetical protein n=1 Tax=Glycomyces amatae TaxID=2881355 RepID=UPI001E324C3B|nr:hypothetical protein [Glycomyces amatae]MCD0443995.1 hypothetical protein [Glycomyces amatae]
MIPTQSQAGPAAPSPAPPPRTGTWATMFLCAGTYLDREYRDYVIDQIYMRPDRGIAPNPGADAAPVLRHALKVRRLEVLQQSILLSGLVFLLVAAANPLVPAVGLALWALAGWPVLVLESRLGTSQAGRRSTSARPTRWPRLHAGTAVGLFCLALFLAAAVAAITATALSAEAAGAEPAAARPAAGLLRDLELVIGGGTALGLIAAVFGLLRARGLISIPTDAGPPAPPDPRIAYIDEAQSAPVVAYGIGKHPFVGSGRLIGPWEFAIALRPKDADADMTVDAVDLNRSVKASVQKLDARTGGAGALPNLALSDHLYVSGGAVLRPVRHAHELPHAGFPFQSLEEVQRSPVTAVRHYLRCTVSSWDGELVTTVLLHCALQGESLYVEFAGCILPPIAPRYHVFGEGRVPDWATLVAGALRGAASMPVLLVRSPFDSVHYLLRALRNAVRSKHDGVRALRDRGAVHGVRELGTHWRWLDYFQYRDSVKYRGILELQFLDAITHYLRGNNVDTSELEQRVAAIMNTNIVNFGQFTAGAAGTGATAFTGAVGDGSSGTATGGKP